jgi:mono/diheme cytochrome c family protein
LILAAGAILVALVGGYLVLKSGLIPVNADASAGKVEKWLAGTSRDAAVERSASKEENPFPRSEDNLRHGLGVYTKNCRKCHGGAEADSTLGRSMYPKAPQFRSSSPDDPDAQLFWIIQHGIRLTGMPSFSNAQNRMLKNDEMWQVVTFIKSTRSLPPPVEAEWKAAR